MNDFSKIINQIKEETYLRKKFNENIYSVCGDGVYRNVIDGVSEEDYEKMAKELRREGHRESEIAGNRFISVPDGKGYIYMTYIPCIQRICVYYTDEGELIPEALGDAPAQNDELFLAQITPDDPPDINGNETNFGMCYIFTLGDGHFLIYDGLGDRREDDLKIMSFIRSHTPEGKKPIIDLWIFTHPHFDHVAGAKKLALKYSDELVVRNFVMNMADRSRYEIMTVREMAACQDDWLPCIFSKFSDAKIYKAHTGQRFSVGCAEVEVLYTQEEYPFDYVHKLNDTSMVTRVYYAGKTFLFPADIEGAAASKLLHDTYGKHLKSDYYQVAHHGWEAEALYYYHDVDPEVVLFPIRYRHWFRERYLSFPHATLVKKEMDEGTRKVCPSLTEDWIFEF